MTEARICKLETTLVLLNCNPKIMHYKLKYPSKSLAWGELL
jgi:hypothetical protein